MPYLALCPRVAPAGNPADTYDAEGKSTPSAMATPPATVQPNS